MNKKKIKVDGHVIEYFVDEEYLDKLGFVGFIYVTKNILTNKFYVGKSHFIKMSGPWQSYLGSGYDLKADIKKYGTENFKRIIIDLSDDKKSLTRLENFYINKFQAIEKRNWYNSPRKREQHGLPPFEEIKSQWR